MSTLHVVPRVSSHRLAYCELGRDGGPFPKSGSSEVNVWIADTLLNHLWILAVIGASTGHFLHQSVLATGVSGEEEEGVAQQAVLGPGQQLQVGEGVRVAAPVVHDGVPVAVWEGEHTLEHPKMDESEERQNRQCVKGRGAIVLFNNSLVEWSYLDRYPVAQESFQREIERRETKRGTWQEYKDM